MDYLTERPLVSLVVKEDEPASTRIRLHYQCLLLKPMF